MMLSFMDLGDLGMSFSARYRRSYGRLNSFHRTKTVTIVNTLTDAHALGHYSQHIKSFTLAEDDL
jgi:hypothetical protein